MKRNRQINGKITWSIFLRNYCCHNDLLCCLPRYDTILFL